ncbi:Arylsulphatase [Xylariaceae sp. FL1019]|nr:Arylsulphatase [Xylariaceae sp. FL1019]
MRSSVALLGALTVSSRLASSQEAQAPLTWQDGRRPNIVFILTDDQDVHLNSLDYMPFVKKHIIEKGTSFKKHYCTTSLCCPSRVTLWTGKLAHNTNITDVKPPYGGYPKFVSRGYNDDWFPVWLQEAGYNSYYTGKLFNAHTVSNYNSPFPRGFAGTDFLLDPYTYSYLNSTFQSNSDAPKSYEGQYSTDVLAEKAYALLDQAVNDEEGKPFFLTIAPIGPHSNVAITEGPNGREVLFSEPIPAERHKDLFPDEIVPRTPSFNPEFPSGADWIHTLPLQNESNVAYNDHFHRQRLRSLQAVDELVDSLMTRLSNYEILDNTYIIYSSDNGFHIGQHRLQPGKTCGYEEDINVPLIIRGPGVAANESVNLVTTHTDLAPTFLSLLGIPLREDFDGSPIPVTKAQIEGAVAKGKRGGSRKEHANIEFWGSSLTEGTHQARHGEFNTYKSLRLSGEEYDFYYSVWCTNEHELYDMRTDPYQLTNLLSPSNSPSSQTNTSSSFTNTPSPNTTTNNATSPLGITISSTPPLTLPISSISARLDALLFVLKSCSGVSCRFPWLSLHPEGDVSSLVDALDPKFDHFYEEEMVRVYFAYCANGLVPSAEGPVWRELEEAKKGMGESDSEGSIYLREGVAWDVWV